MIIDKKLNSIGIISSTICSHDKIIDFVFKRKREINVFESLCKYFHHCSHPKIHNINLISLTYRWLVHKLTDWTKWSRSRKEKNNHVKKIQLKDNLLSHQKQLKNCVYYMHEGI